MTAIDFTYRELPFHGLRKTYYAKRMGVEENEFIIGRSTFYKNHWGIMSIRQPDTPVYNPENYKTDFGFWSYFIHPTALAESNGSFVCANTYDRAKFTYGFMQYAAHVPNGDFVKFFKKFLALPFGYEYFPKLELKGDRIFYVSDKGVETQLESNESTQGLMDYLNPSLDSIDRQEIITLARFIHATLHKQEILKLFVSDAVELFKNKMKRYSKRFHLKDMPDFVCLLICDILHQGRGTYDTIAKAIDTGKDAEKAYSNLCHVGYEHYSGRINTLKKIVSKYRAENVFGKIYNETSNEFE